MKNIFTFFKGLAILIVFGFSMNAVRAQSNALSFDGVDDFVIAYNLLEGSGTGPFTLEAWIKAPAPSAKSIIIALGLDATHANYPSDIDLFIDTDGKLKADFKGAAGPRSSTVVADNSWHHIAFTYSTGTSQLYVDGAKNGIAVTVNHPNLINTSINFGSLQGYTYHYTGLMDEIRVWNVARTTSDIYNNMNVPVDPATSGLKQYYNFNQGIASGDNTGMIFLNDCSPNHSNAYIERFALTGPASNFVAGKTLNVTVDNFIPPQRLGVLEFDGLSDNVEIGEANEIDNTSFTLELWCKVDAGDKNYFFSAGKTSDNYGLYLGYSDGGYFNFSTGSGSPQDYYSPTIQRTGDFGHWVHWACVWTKTGDHMGTRTVYKNGELLYGPSAPVALNLSAAHVNSSVWEMEISAYKGTSDYSFDGQITEFRLWKDALPQDTIRRYYKSEIQKEGHGYWKTGNDKLIRYYQTVVTTDINNKKLTDASGHHDCTNSDFNFDATMNGAVERIVSPPIPFKMTARTNACNPVTISWNGSKDSPLYWVYRDGIRITSTFDTSYQYTCTPGTNYTYTVRSSRSSTDTAYQKTSKYSFSAIGNVNAILNAPDNLRADNNACDGKITLAWDVSGTVPTTYELQRSDGNLFTTYVRVDTAISGSLRTVDNIPPSDGTWYYRMRSKNACGLWGSYGTIVSAVYYANIAAPTGLTASVVNNKIVLNWTNSGINKKPLIIKRKKSADADYTILNPAYSKDSVRFTDANFLLCTDYIYQLEVMNHCDTLASNSTLAIRVMPDLTHIITLFTATKGEYRDMVMLQWKYNNSGNPALYDHFEILQSDDNDTAFSHAVSIVDNVGKSLEQYQIDNTHISGFADRTVKRYWIRAVSNCEGTTLYSNRKNDLGFSNPTSTINGLVTYIGPAGQAEPNVKLMTSGGTYVKSNKSLKFDSIAKTYVRIPRSVSADFTLEYWIKTSQHGPAATDWTSGKGIVDASAAGQAKIFGTSLVNNGILAFGIGNPAKTIKSVKRINDNLWHHVAVTRKKSSGIINLYIDGKLEATDHSTNTDSLNASAYISLGSMATSGPSSTNYFNGNLDEIRFWNVVRDSISIKNNYNRILGGKDSTLVAYYRLEDNCASMIFDCSQSSGGGFNKNHSTVVSGAVSSTDAPANSMLNFSGLTALNGYYSIDQLPVQGLSEIITVTPVFETHQFQPLNRIVSVDKNQTYSNINFKDSSVFSLTGVVLYKGTTCGVPGISFNIDGQIQMKNNAPIVTGNTGQFELQVPMDWHTVTPVKQGHAFVNNLHQNFDAPVSGQVFIDSTIIRVIGSVVGGNIEGSKQPGFGHCKNNMGTARIDIRSNQSNCTFNKTFYTDSYTGEYSVDLPPMEFLFGLSSGEKGITIGSNKEPKNLALDSTLNAQTSRGLNLSVYLPVQTAYDSAYTYYDSASVTLRRFDHLDSIKYNTISNFIYISDPSLVITNANGLPFKGDSIFPYNDFGVSGNYQLSNLPYPSFTSGNSYGMKITTYELYTNKDPFYAVPSRSVVIDTVPILNGVVSITNGIADQPKQTYNSDGSMLYGFTAGSPKVIGDFLKLLEIEVKAGEKPVKKWTPQYPSPWFGLKAYVFGQIARDSSKDFITKGPTEIIKILRDPPGSGSYSYIEEGTEWSESENVQVSNGVDVNQSFKLYAKAEVGALGFSFDSNNGITLGGHAGYTKTNGDSWSMSLTTMDRWQTSDSPELPGDESDVFIGGTKTYTFGATDAVFPTSDTLVSLNRGTMGFLCNDPVSHSGFRVTKRTGMSISPGGFATTFMYTKNHIETVVIPEIINARNLAILQEELDPNSHYTFHYGSLNIDATDPHYGTNNDDPIWDTSATTSDPAISQLADYDGPSYTYRYTNVDSINDIIRDYNQDIRIWRELLVQNETDKINARDTVNISFGGQLQYERSVTNSASKGTSTTKEIRAGGFLTLEWGFSFKLWGVTSGLQGTSNIAYDFNKNTDHETNSGTSTTYGYVLNDNDIGDQFLTKVKLDSTGNGPVFQVLGGRSMCPWEARTIQREVPQAYVRNSTQLNIPSDQPAVFETELGNASESNDAMTYNLRVLQETNQHGYTVKVNGVTIEDYLAFTIPAGSSINSIITVEAGPLYFDYDSLDLMFYSPCEYELGTGKAQVHLRLYFSFVPPCQTMNIYSPLDQFVVNSLHPDTLNFDLGGFPYGWNYQKNIQIQYKPVTGSVWNTIATYWKNAAIRGNSTGDPLLPTTGSSLSFPWDVSSKADGNYQLRVLGYCGVSDKASPLITGVFDRICPAPFGNPQPSDGILGAGDELSIQFNEAVDGTAFEPGTFDISGVLNGTTVRHSTSVGFDGATAFMKMSGVNVAGKSFAVEFWMLRNTASAGVKQTILSQGNDPANCFIVGIDENNKLFMQLKNRVFSSNTVVLDTVWHHWVVSYDNTDTLIEFYKDADLLASIPANIDYQGYGDVYVAKPTVVPGYAYLNANMHELRIWGKSLFLTDFITNIASKLSGRESKLIGCWPMDEGKGTLVSDIAHSRNATLTNGTWQITPAGTALHLGSSSYAEINTQKTVFTSDQDFSIEFWFKSANGSNICLFSNGSGNNGLYNRNTWSVRSNASGMLQVVNNGITTNIATGYFDDNWHHFAMSVNRMGNLSVYLDGIFKAGTSGSQFSGFAAAKACIGAQITRGLYADGFSDFYTGSVDEVRIWNLWRTQDQINRDMNFRLKGSETGLQLYYPFEKYTQIFGRDILTPTFNNIAGSDTLPATMVGPGANYDHSGPAIKLERPVQAVNFTYLLNNDKVIFTPTTPNAQIENCILDITVKGVKDLHNNTMKSPRTWTAYVDRNPLVWGSQDVILTKNIYDPLSFTVTLTNKGGNMESYSINNLPDWLSCSPQTGTIWPTATITVTFTVNSGLNIGNYIVDIPATSSFGYDETFVLKLDVVAPAPNWSVNPADYVNSMNVIGEVAVDSILSTDKNDIIGVFSGNVCRGVGRLQYISAVDKWETFLDIYSNDTSISQPLNFKVWDASAGVIRSEVTPALNFEANAVLGTVMHPIYINATEAQDQFIALRAGWNWFSLNLTSPHITDVNYVLQDVQATTGDLVKAQIANYAQFTSGLGWNGSLISSGNFKNDQMYMMKVAHPDTIRFVGKIVNPDVTPITIRNGWSWIGFVPQTNFTVNEAMATYLGAQNGDVIKGQSSFAMYQTGMNWIGSLSYMKPGEGYMYKSYNPATGTFYYPKTGTGLKRGEETLPVTPLAWNNNMAQYENNLSLVASVIMGELGVVNDNMVLGAFVNNICRGYIRPTWIAPTNSYLFFLPVNSSELNGENVSFRLFDPSLSFEYNINETIAFEANTVQGNIEHPVILTIADVTGISTNNVLSEYYLKLNPNPFRNEAIISYGLKEDAHVNITVYNILGVKIDVLTDKQMQKGVWSQKWNGTNENGVKLSPGVYYIGLKANKFSSQIKVIITN